MATDDRRLDSDATQVIIVISRDLSVLAMGFL